MSAVHNIPAVYLNVGRNFGLSTADFISRVLYPAVVPQLIIGSRITLGIAWLVVVAAEMIAVNSGLGFLIIDARNAGNRYDLVIAGMVMIGTIGLLLDLGMRSLERVKSFRWSIRRIKRVGRSCNDPAGSRREVTNGARRHGVRTRWHQCFRPRRHQS